MEVKRDREISKPMEEQTEEYRGIDVYKQRDKYICMRGQMRRN